MTRPRPRLRHLSLLVAFACGCASTSTSSTSTLDGALSAYDAGRFETALSMASRASESGLRSEIHRAEYVAGLAAYRLGDLNGAARALERARLASDDELSARASATLGLVRMSEGRNREAADLLKAAAPDLSATDRREADDAARRARGDVRSGPVPEGTFTLQIGAFQSRVRAETARKATADTARRTGLDAPRLTVRDDSRTGRLYVVQVGHFASRGAAAAARNRHGLSDWLVASLH